MRMVQSPRCSCSDWVEMLAQRRECRNIRTVFTQEEWDCDCIPLNFP